MISQTGPAREGAAQRVEYLDQFRGFTVTMMILVNILAEFSIVPVWLKHAKVPGLITVPDFVIPAFLFVIGVSLDLAFTRSIAKYGPLRTTGRFIRRSLLLIGFGILGSVLLRHNIIREWGVLETLGGAGLVALPFMFLRPRWRPLYAVLLVGLYEVIARSGVRDWLATNDSGHLGGIAGALAWAGIVLLGSFAGNFIRTGNERGFRLSTAVIAVTGILAGLVLNLWLPAFKPLVTPAYLLTVTGAASGMLLLFSLLKPRFLPFKVFGVNALAIFMLHGIVLVTVMKLMPASGSLPIVLMTLAGVYGLCWAVAGVLYRLRIFIRL